MADNPPRHIAVIDIGKTNIKLVLFDRATGQQLAALGQTNAVIDGRPYPHYDIDGIWRFILDGLKKLHAAHRIDGISITTHGATAALIAGDSLALPVLDYEHTGPDDMAAAYEAIRPGFSQTLSPRLPAGLNLGAQIYWQAQTFPEEFNRVTAILMYPQYWAWRLTGQLASEVTSLGCHTDLWNPLARDFSALVESQGWRRLFPDIRPAASVLGTITPAIADTTGLTRQTPVACGIHDSNASLLPWLQAVEPPFTVISSGTWTIHMTVGGGTGGLDPARDSLANVDAHGRPVPTARFMGGRDFGLLAGDDAPEPEEADISRVVGRGIMALPGAVPGVGPFPKAKGGWVGDSGAMTPAERSAAATLYLVLVTRACLDLCGAGDKLLVEGPLARNMFYCRLLSTMTGRPVYPSADATGTSLGAAMLFEGEPAGVDPGLAAEPLHIPGFESYAARWRELAGSS